MGYCISNECNEDKLYSLFNGKPIKRFKEIYFIIGFGGLAKMHKHDIFKSSSPNIICRGSARIKVIFNKK